MSSSPDATTCNELPLWGYPLGIVMGVVGSVGINVGQNLQASGLQQLPEEERTRPQNSKQWRCGLILFVLFSLINFAALALAPASVLTPLESIQFVTNIVWNRFVNRKFVSRRMVAGTCIALVGTVLSVAFGAEPSGCHSLAQLEGFWSAGAWWVYVIATLAIAVSALLFHEVCTRRARRKLPLPSGAAILLPVAYTLSSALAGGAQSMRNHAHRARSSHLSLSLSHLSHLASLASLLFSLSLSLSLSLSGDLDSLRGRQ